MSGDAGGSRPGIPYLQIGATVGSYRIESFVALGGMAFVYEATDMRLGRHVALKLLAPALAQELDFRERFMRESRFAASLDHPNIVPIYEAGEADGLLFIAMRFVDGVNLDTYLQQHGRLNLDRTLAILTPIADALDAAHAAGLVHRDVKPANILLASSGREGREHVYLTDFGITKRTSGLTKLTATGNVIGTMSYTAPEQILGEKLDSRTDLYALGCVVFQCLTGTAPFVRDNQGALVWAHLNDQPAPVSSHRQVLAPVDEVVARALEKDPERRYARCEDFTDALSGALPLVGDGADELTDVVPTSSTRGRSARTTVGPAAVEPAGGTDVPAAPTPTEPRPAGQGLPTGPAAVPTTGPAPVPGPTSPGQSNRARHRARRSRSGTLVPVALAVLAVATLCVALIPLSGRRLESGTAQPLAAGMPMSGSSPMPDTASTVAMTAGMTAGTSAGMSGGMSANGAMTGDQTMSTQGSGHDHDTSGMAGMGGAPSRDLVTAAAGSAVNPPAGTAPAAVQPSPAVAIPSVDGQPLPVGTTPGSVTITPNGRFAYVANRTAGTVTVVDTNVDKVSATIPISAGPPRYIAFTPDGARAYVSTYTDDMTVNRVAVLDTRTTRELRTIEVDNGPYALAVTPDQKFVYVPSHDAAKIDVIDTSTDTVVRQIAVPINPHSVTFSPDGTMAYVADHQANVVSILDVGSGSVLKTIPVGTSPHSVALSPDATRLAVVCYDSSDVYFIDPADAQVVGTVPVGHHPQDVTYSPDGSYVYTANVDDNSVSVVDTATRTVTATIPTDSPTSIAVRPDGQKAYVTNLNAGTLTILNTSG